MKSGIVSTFFLASGRCPRSRTSTQKTQPNQAIRSPAYSPSRLTATMALLLRACSTIPSKTDTKPLAGRTALNVRSKTKLAAISAPREGGGAVPGYSFNPTDKNGHQVVLSENTPYIDVCLAGSLDDACWFGDFPGRVTLDLPEEELPAALAVFEHMHTDALPHDWELLAKMCKLAYQWELQPTLEACLAELRHQVATHDSGQDLMSLAFQLPHELFTNTAGGQALLREMQAQGRKIYGP